MPQSQSFLLELNTEGDGGTYRIKNEEGQINRGAIVDRGDKLVVQADLIAVAHGTLTDTKSPKGAPATLVVTDFRFLPSKARRFTWAKITYRFDKKDGSSAPEVSSIGPHGKFNLHPVSVHVEKGHKIEATLEAPVGPVTPGLTYGWDLRKGYDTADHTTLWGAIRLRGKDSGPKNSAEWELKENATTSTGIPTRLRAAVVLKHKVLDANAQFQATVEIEVDADIKSKMGLGFDRLLGRIPKDDPIVFDPAEPLVPDDVVVKSLNNLAKEDLCLHYLVETSTRSDE